MMTEVEALNGDVVLSGSVWTPDDREPRLLVLMHPGSGPSDRDNDVFFPPIRAALLAAGCAVASFDKRGVGGSTGDWLEAGIDEQAEDLVASLEVVRAVVRAAVPDIPVGLFGHSQGGWVVLQAASNASVDFVITNSRPGVTPRVQEEFSARSSLERAGFDASAIAPLLGLFRELCDRMATADDFDEVAAWMRAPDRAGGFDTLATAGAFIPDDRALWEFACRIIDHDPAPALEALRVPILALFGRADTVVPVDLSAEVFRLSVRPELLTLVIADGGDHRMQFPGTEEFVPSYLPGLVSFVESHGAIHGRR